MKLFAGLEKISEEQAERLKEAQEKRAEEKNEDEEISEEELPTASQTVQLEADSVAEMLEKIFGVKWGEEVEESA